MKFKIKESKLQGKGIFATSNIKKREKVCNFNGKEVSMKELRDIIVEGKERKGDSLQIGFRKYINLFETYRCFNHSCTPDAGIKGKNSLFALINIKKGTEITFDYSTTMWEETEIIQKKFGKEFKAWTMKCFCKSKYCRKKIDQFYNLPKKIQEKYLKLGFVSGYILKWKRI